MRWVLRRWLRRRRELRGLLLDASALIATLNSVVVAQNVEIEEWKRLALMSHRTTRDLVRSFRLAVDPEELDIRADLDRLLNEYADEVARLEEHLV